MFLKTFIHSMSHLLPDGLYLKLYYHYRTRQNLNLKNPTTFNEKLQWLKLHDRNPLYTTMVDKYLAKEYVGNIIGNEHIIPTLGVWDSFDEIVFDKLPNQFVLKCNHDSGSVVICHDKNTFDFEKARKKLTRCLKTNSYYYGREWPYKNIKRKIIAEEYLEDLSTGEARDYKFFCFNGVVKVLYVVTGRNMSKEETKAVFFDTSFNKLPFINDHPNTVDNIKKPMNFDKMIEMSELLSEGIPQVRCDFYEVNGKVFFGEMTFFHNSGFCSFKPEEWDEKLGSWISLPNKIKRGGGKTVICGDLINAFHIRHIIDAVLA